MHLCRWKTVSAITCVIIWQPAIHIASARPRRHGVLRRIAAVGRPQDVALGISPSGNCPNVLRGLRQAKAIGLQTAGLTGGTGGQMQGVCDVLIVVPATATATASARIQEMHGMIGHMLCRALEMRLGPWSRIYPDADPIHSAAPQKERHHVDSRLCPAGYR